MRTSSVAFRSHLFTVAGVVTLSGIAAGCSNFLGDRGLFTGATQNQREIISSYAPDDPLPAPTTGVTRNELPPPPGSQFAMTTPPAASYPGVSYPGAAYPPAPAIPTSDSFAWSAVGGKVITIAAGETLDTLTMKYGVPQSEILRANQLASASQITPGRVIVMPHLVMLAPGQTAPTAVAAAPAAARPEASGATYTVITGDTLYGISRKTGTDANAIIALNGLAGQAQLRTGQVLKLPAPAGSLPAAPVNVAAAPAVPKPTLAPVQVASNGVLPKIMPSTSTEPSKLRPPAVPALGAGAQIPATQASLTPPKATVDPDEGPSANGTTFRWPVRGRIIANFGSSPGGQRNDGINLAVPEGTSVKAAEAGTVIYAGNELEGYGNLILVRHADGWVSAYAHNKDLMVKRGDPVVRGQIIAHAGKTGSVATPQVHFELRQGSKPVNPLDYLSG
jgi:murein DD-endopeptidase MepM/ murein hydrolase activator NlpD